MAKFEVFILLLFFVFFIQSSHSKETQVVPVKCALNDSVCLTTEAQKTLELFIEGIPKLGIKQFDKLLVDPIIVQTANFSFEWTNIIVGGLRTAIIDNISIDMDLKVMRVAFHTNMLMEFDYNTNGLLFSIMNVFGDGKGKITLSNTHIEMLFMFDIVKDANGNNVMDLISYYHGLDAVDGIRFEFDNMFNGDSKKSEILHNILNKNWRTMLANFGRYADRKITVKLFDAVKTYMRSRPIEDMALY